MTEGTAIRANSSSREREPEDEVEALRARLMERERELASELARVRRQLSRFRGGDGGAVSYGRSTQAIYDAVAARPGATSTQIAADTGLARGSIYKLLRGLVARGFLRREGEGPRFRYHAVAGAA